MNARQEKVLGRLRAAVSDPNPEFAAALLGDVFYDLSIRDGLGYLVEYGYDTDDLAAVLLPILQAHFNVVDGA